MRKTSIIKLFCITLVLLASYGCSPRLTQEIIFDSAGRKSMNQDGIIIVDYSGCICFADYETGRMIPLCGRANCRHDEAPTHEERESCFALYPNGDIVQAFLYNDKVYVLVNEGVNHCVMYRSDADGSNRKKLSEADFGADSYRVKYNQDRLIFSARVYSYSQEGQPDEKMDYFIACYDLRKNRFSEVTERHHDYGQINVTDVQDNKLVYFLHEREEMMGNEADLGTSVYSGEQFRERNLETGEDKELFTEGFETAFYEDGKVFYFVSVDDGYALHEYNCSNKKDHVLKTADSPTAYWIAGEILLYSELDEWQKKVLPVCEYDSWLLVLDTSAEAESGTKLGIIKTTEYIKGEGNIIYLQRGVLP